MNNNLNELQKLVKIAVADFKIEDALEYMGEINDLLDDDEFETNLLNLSSRYNRYKKAELQGTNDRESQIYLNTIVNSIINLLKGVKKIADRKSFYSNIYINRFYKEDLKNIDNIWKLDKIINKNTILIITGCHIFVELLDKVAAYKLKDAIDSQGNYQDRKRAIVMGDTQFIADTNPNHSDDVQEKKLINLPLISIGGPAANLITQDLKERHDEIYRHGHFTFAYRDDNGIRKVAVWGHLAIDTQNAVDEFIKSKENGLKHFLEKIWQ